MESAPGYPQTLAVIGGSSDIGIAVARALVPKGLRRIVLAGRDKNRLVDAAHRIGAEVVSTDLWDKPGPDDGDMSGQPAIRPVAAEGNAVAPTVTPGPTLEAFVTHCEALDFASHEGAVEDIVTAAGGDLDACLIAVGILGDQQLAERDPDHLAEIIATNFTAPARLGLLVARRMQEQGHGLIVVLSSVAGERVRRSNFAYGASKAGLDGFFQGMSSALVPVGVRTMLVRPGFVRTKMTAGMKAPPLAASPDDVARAVVRGISLGKEIVWVPASARLVMTVIRHLPTPVFRRIPF